MIADVDETLRRLLVAELPKINRARKPGDVRVTFDPPAVAEKDADGSLRLNLYLHDIRENTQLRDDSIERIRPTTPGDPMGGDMIGKRRGAVRLNLAYLLTAHAGGDTTADPRAEHTLLADTLAVLLRSSVVPDEYLAGAVAEENAGLPLSVAQPEHPALSDPATLWMALGGKLRPTLALTALASFNPFETKWTRFVREAVLGIGQGTPASGGGPKRPVEVRGVRVSVAGVLTESGTGGGADGEEKPLPDVRVCVIGKDEIPATRSDARGFFYLLDLPPGAHRLRLEKRGYRTAEREFTAPPPGRSDRMEAVIASLARLETEAGAADIAAGKLEESGGNAAPPPPVLRQAERNERVTLSGVLRYADDRPAAYLPVRLGTRFKTLTDGDGFYAFYDLAKELVAKESLIAEVPGVGEVVVPGGGTAASAAGLKSGAKSASKILPPPISPTKE